jgi:hypothetical protein
VALICKCNTPGNPDRTQIGCSTETCKKWLHEECVKHHALMRTYERLGKDKPHVSSARAKDGKALEDEATRPLSPSETDAAGSVQDSIGVKSSDIKDNIDVGGADDAPATGRKTADTEKSVLDTLGSGRKVGRPKKKGPTPETNGDTKPNDKPYEGLFKVEMRTDLDNSPPVLIFKDLRQNVEGGDKEWKEPIACLCCGNQIV